MAKFLVIQIALSSLVMAQQIFGHNDSPDGWWFHVTAVRNSSGPTSTSCLLQSQPVVKRDDYTYTRGIGGHKFHTRPLSWNDARRTCEEEGGHLAIINSVREAEVLVELYNKSGSVVGATGSTAYAMIGFHDLFNEGEHVTIHSQSLSRAGYNQWAPGQPDNSNGQEDCGSIDRKGELHDIGCFLTRGFICEVPHY